MLAAGGVEEGARICVRARTYLCMCCFELKAIKMCGTVRESKKAVFMEVVGWSAAALYGHADRWPRDRYYSLSESATRAAAAAAHNTISHSLIALLSFTYTNNSAQP